MGLLLPSFWGSCPAGLRHLCCAPYHGLRVKIEIRVPVTATCSISNSASFNGVSALLTCAACVMQEQELKQAGMLQGGVLTPASAMGSLLVDRLNAAGMTFKLEDAGHGSASEE